MLKKEVISKIAAALKLDAAAFETALTSTEEADITIPENLTVLTAEELSSRDKITEKKGYDKGAEASVEMLVKEQKRTFGLEFEGKDPAKLFEAFKTKVLADAKVEPSAALQEKETIISGLRANLLKLEQEKNEVASSVAKIRLESQVAKAIPTNLIAGVEPDEVLLTMRHKGYDFEEKDGQIVAKRNGEVVADTALRPIPIKDVINSYVMERKWIDDGAGAGDGKAGRGGGHSNPKLGTPKKLSEVEAQWKAEGKNTGTAEFESHVAGIMKENKDFDINA